jgi:Na+/proline symporter
MRIFTLICSLLLIALGAAGYYGWGSEGEGPRTLVSAIPGGFGALMLFGVLVALLLRRTGLQIAVLAAIAGAFSGLGRLTPVVRGRFMFAGSFATRPRWTLAGALPRRGAPAFLPA